MKEASHRGIPAQEIRDIERLVFQYRKVLLEKYHEIHGR
jgi:hypothetical protein